MKEQQKQVLLKEVWLCHGIGRSKCHKISSYNIDKVLRINRGDVEEWLENRKSSSGDIQ